MNAAGAPFPGFYQFAYVTTDMERAQSDVRATHGIGGFLDLTDMRYQTGLDREAHCHVALAYAGAMEIELIQPLDGDVAIYRDVLPEAGYGLRFHHVARLFETDAEFDATFAAYQAQGRSFPILGSAPGTARYFYCDMRADLGHYIEGIVFTPEAREWLASIPRF